MAKIVAIVHLSLDGVYQAPARADEDTRDGFKHGGWAMAGSNSQLQEAIGKSMAGGWSLLAGTTTYEDLFDAWPKRQPDDPMTHALTSVQKFVTSHDQDYHLPWENSVLLAGEATATVGKLKNEHDKTLIIFGSGELVRSLMHRALIDEFVLMIHPKVLNEGRRLFDGFPITEFRLVDKMITDTGVIIATYQYC